MFNLLSSLKMLTMILKKTSSVFPSPLLDQNANENVNNQNESRPKQELRKKLSASKSQDIRLFFEDQEQKT